MAPKAVSLPQPDAPKNSASPLESLQPNPHYQESVAAKYGYAFVGAVSGGVSVVIANYFNRKPIASGIYKYPLAIAAGAASVYALQVYKERQWAQRDAIFRHYISLHPEDFPPYERIKIGSLFEDWTPIR